MRQPFVWQPVSGPLPSVIAMLNRTGRNLEQWLGWPTYPLGMNIDQAVLTYAAAVTWTPFIQGANARIVLTGACTITIDTYGLPVGSIITLTDVQDATGGRVTTWGGTNILWGDAAAPVFNTAANKRNVVRWLVDSDLKLLGTKWGTGY